MSDHPTDIRIGISSCLLGEKVRYDGGHKRSDYIVDVLGRQVTFVPVCPEVEVGMGVPRETLHLIDSPESPRMVTTRTGIDHTGRMLAFSRERVRELEGMDLSGYILKKDSPSCGMERVKVRSGNGAPARKGRGLFAGVLMASLPHLPVEEEGRLSDPALRENFIERVFCYRRWRDMTRGRASARKLSEFHARHKFLIMAHSERHMRALGRLAAKKNPEIGEYERGFFEALALLPTVRKHVNVLQHLCGFFKTKLEDGDRRELLEAIEEYRTGLLPRIVPVTLIKHHLKKLDLPYVAEQAYFTPHPKELLLQISR